MPATPKPKLYNPSHPERTLLYQTIAEYFETWLELASAGQFDGQGFSAAHTSTGSGLPGMHSRANEIGATLEFNSTVGQGTTWRLALAQLE